MNLKPAERWFATQGWDVFPFQRTSWERFDAGYNGTINAPTGSGKTYALVIPILLEIKENQATGNSVSGIKAI